MTTISKTYYRIRFTADVHYFKAGSYYSSNNGTTEWGELKKVKALLTRGIPAGYKGRFLIPFTDYEVVEVKEIIQRTETVVTI